MIRQAKYKVGDLVRHVQQGYLAVIVDIDPIFQASGRYNPQAEKRAFSTRNPWYRLLVDESAQATYVEECQLEKVESGQSIDNPLMSDFLVEQQGRYAPSKKSH